MLNTRAPASSGHTDPSAPSKDAPPPEHIQLRILSDLDEPRSLYRLSRSSQCPRCTANKAVRWLKESGLIELDEETRRFVLTEKGRRESSIIKIRRWR